MIPSAYLDPTVEQPNNPRSKRYPAALVQGSKHAAESKKFLDYLGEPDSLKTFEKYGFITKG